MIPGSNLLTAALRIIGRQPVRYLQDIGRQASATGRDVTQYADPVEITESIVQPMSGQRVAQSGLDTQKCYVTWWVPADIIGIGRDVSGDMIEYNGSRYQCQTETDWFGQDGWKEVTCVRTGHAG